MFEQTSLIAAFAVRLMHEAGFPSAAIQLLPGTGAIIGAALSADTRIAGICFTGSTATAKRIDRNMAEYLAPQAPLIAETGGLNAMIVDSTALPEQVVRDVLASAFQSAGQRCSALRMLYLQEDIADKVLEMLFGAMDELRVGNPWDLATDIGPVIDVAAKQKIDAHCDKHAAAGRLLKQLPVPAEGLFVSPCVIGLDGIEQLDEEIFGPVLHVARYPAQQIDAVVDAINASGYGLTFGMHTRVDSRVDQVVSRIHAGNIYVNRNQIGAVVGTQPFGGEGLSGTGPKAGGPSYLRRFLALPLEQQVDEEHRLIDVGLLQDLVDASREQTIDVSRLNQLARHEGLRQDFESRVGAEDMPGPTGETNRLSAHPRGRILCLGPTLEMALEQAIRALAQQNSVVIVAPEGDQLADLLNTAGFPAVGIAGSLAPGALSEIEAVDAVMSRAQDATLGAYRQALSLRDGSLIPLICESGDDERLVLERHLCIDTTAAGGNASLIAAGG